MGKKWTEEDFRRELEGFGVTKVQEMLEAGTWAGPADKKLQLARQYVQELKEGHRTTTEANVDAVGAKDIRTGWRTYWVQLIIGLASVAVTIAIWGWLKPLFN